MVQSSSQSYRQLDERLQEAVIQGLSQISSMPSKSASQGNWSERGYIALRQAAAQIIVSGSQSESSKVVSPVTEILQEFTVVRPSASDEREAALPILAQAVIGFAQISDGQFEEASSSYKEALGHLESTASQLSPAIAVQLQATLYYLESVRITRSGGRAQEANSILQQATRLSGAIPELFTLLMDASMEITSQQPGRMARLNPQRSIQRDLAFYQVVTGDSLPFDSSLSFPTASR